MAETTLMVTGGLKKDPPVIMAVDGTALDSNRVVEVPPDQAGARVVVGCGKTLEDQEVLIVDPESRRQLSQGSVGEIWVAGPSVAQGYWNKPDLTREMFQARLAGSDRGPYLRTGDLGFLWEGELFVTGRLKDLIIVRGVNRYPQDIEATVQASHPLLHADAGAAVVAEVGGRDRLIIVNEADRPRGKGFDEVFAAIRREVAAEHELPVDAIALIRARTIPKTSSGKIQRYACAKEYLEGTLPLLAHWCSWEGEEGAPSVNRVSPPATSDTPVAGGPK
jgi:acyl-CoA synthetase (AMP-forming)/AMP-acid ligase II